MSTGLILHGFDQKNKCFEEWSGFKFNNLGLVLGIDLNCDTSFLSQFSNCDGVLENYLDHKFQ